MDNDVQRGDPAVRGMQQIGHPVVWGGLIAWILWAGASRSIQAGTARRELGRHTTASVMRPAVCA